VDSVVDIMMGNSRAMVRLEGHCDERGSREYNMALGENRAIAVLNHLVDRGVDRTRIETISYGEEQPAALGHTESDYRLNRRVEFRLGE
jgi:peptidoglycan-associated lipoprotein